jgi:ATP-dependent Clp protease adaptor protein ClpS
MSGDIPNRQEEYSPEIDVDITEPPDYKVLLHNDDYTTKAFVVELLMMVFNKSLEEATHLMWYVHKNNIGVCGIYSLEVADTKIDQGATLARENGFPLKLTLEKE